MAGVLQNISKWDSNILPPVSEFVRTTSLQYAEQYYAKHILIDYKHEIYLSLYT